MRKKTEGNNSMPVTGTPTPRFDVSDLDQWGRLVKSWAAHLDYVSKPNDPQPPRDYWVNKTWPDHGKKGPASSTTLDTDAEGNPKPWCLPSGGPLLVPGASGGSVTLPFAVAMTVAEFTTRVQAANVTISKMPSQYTNVIIVQGNVGTMVMRLPPKDTLQGSEDDLLLSGEPYPLRQFYDDLYPCEAKYPTTQPTIMELHANRIGEYTLNNCA
jgi:hypothetical protein